MDYESFTPFGFLAPVYKEEKYFNLLNLPQLSIPHCSAYYKKQLVGLTKQLKRSQHWPLLPDPGSLLSSCWPETQPCLLSPLSVQAHAGPSSTVIDGHWLVPPIKAHIICNYSLSFTELSIYKFRWMYFDLQPPLLVSCRPWLLSEVYLPDPEVC